MLGLAYFNIHEGLEFKSLTFDVTWQSRTLIIVAGATAGLGLLLEVLRLVVPKCFTQRDRGGAIPAGMTVATVMPLWFHHIAFTAVVAPLAMTAFQSFQRAC
jgi:hypothetical protein